MDFEISFLEDQKKKRIIHWHKSERGREKKGRERMR